jgi:hypothetical protein
LRRGRHHRPFTRCRRCRDGKGRARAAVRASTLARHGEHESCCRLLVVREVVNVVLDVLVRGQWLRVAVPLQRLWRQVEEHGIGR